MKILFVSANTERMNMPALPLGMASVAMATQEAGHEVETLDLQFEGETRSSLRKAIAEHSPDVIGVSIRNVDDQNRQAPQFLLEKVKEVVADCRRFSKARIVLGGSGYSLFPESALAYLQADMGIQGEGETAFPALLERLECDANLSGIPGLYLPETGLQGTRTFVENLDALPFPEDRLWLPETARDFWLPFQTQRGCPYKCIYCTTGTVEGRTPRTRSPESVVTKIARLADLGCERFFIVDSTFNLPAARAEEICQLLSERRLGIAWRCIVYPRDVNAALVTRMAEAGCVEISLGFESGSERMLRSLRKGFTADDVRQVSRLFEEQGIRRMGFLLLGGPGETRESVETSLAFADSLHLEMTKTTVGMRIYPDTELARVSIEQGMTADDQDLLQPTFYLAEGLEDWLPGRVESWMAKRPQTTV